MNRIIQPATKPECEVVEFITKVNNSKSVRFQLSPYCEKYINKSNGIYNLAILQSNYTFKNVYEKLWLDKVLFYIY